MNTIAKVGKHINYRGGQGGHVPPALLNTTHNATSGTQLNWPTFILFHWLSYLVWPTDDQVFASPGRNNFGVGEKSRNNGAERMAGHHGTWCRHYLLEGRNT